MVNRILGPDGEPARAAQLVTAQISSRPTLEHEPRDVLLEIEVGLPSFDSMKRAVGYVNDMSLALAGKVSIKAPTIKIRVFADRIAVAQVVSWGNQIANLGGGDTLRLFREEKQKPGEDPGADSGTSPQPG